MADYDHTTNLRLCHLRISAITWKHIKLIAKMQRKSCSLVVNEFLDEALAVRKKSKKKKSK